MLGSLGKGKVQFFSLGYRGSEGTLNGTDGIDDAWENGETGRNAHVGGISGCDQTRILGYA